MANPEHLQIFSDPYRWDVWRQQFPHIIPDLRETDMSPLNHIGERNVHRVNWSEANLSYMDLAGINFEEGYFIHAFLQSARLDNASLAFTDMHHVDLSFGHCHRVNMSHANLQEAWLVEAHMAHAQLGSANLQKAHLRKADLRFADLRGATLAGAHACEVIFVSKLLRGSQWP